MEEMLNMQLNEIKTIDFYVIHRVPGGWNYLYRNDTGSIESTCFVPEVLKPVYTKTLLNENTQSDNNSDYHENWIVDYQDKNLNRKSKHIKFTNKVHEENWQKTWERYGNKILGYHKANALGELIT